MNICSGNDKFAYTAQYILSILPPREWLFQKWFRKSKWTMNGSQEYYICLHHIFTIQSDRYTLTDSSLFIDLNSHRYGREKRDAEKKWLLFCVSFSSFERNDDDDDADGWWWKTMQAKQIFIFGGKKADCFIYFLVAQYFTPKTEKERKRALSVGIDTQHQHNNLWPIGNEAYVVGIIICHTHLSSKNQKRKIH